MDRAKSMLVRAELRREEIKKELNPLFIPVFDKMCEGFAGTYWYPYKGLRTFQEQAETYAVGRSEESIKQGQRIVTYAMAGDSAHNWGCATDWVEWQPEWVPKDIWLKSNWEFLGMVAQKSGAVWGGNFKKFADRPHCELSINGSWSAIGDEYRKHGIFGIQELIQSKAKGKTK